MMNPMDNHGDERASSNVAQDPGDLGRRVAMRRQELGMSRQDLAARAGMHQSYLTFLETQAEARPSPAALARLAASLDTSVVWLRGGGLERPVGSGSQPVGVPELQVLGTDECFSLIAPGGVGRVVFDDQRGPVALPVNFRLVGRAVVFRTGHGTILGAVQAGRAVSVEVDHLDDVRGEGWSVLVTGVPSQVVDPSVLEAVANLDLHPWAGGDRPVVVQIVPEETTGRRILRR